jgi:hypothetical protein
VNRVILILGIVAACIVGTIFLLRRSAPATPTWTSYSPLDPSVRVTEGDIQNTNPASATPASQDRAADLAKAFELSEDESIQKISEIVDDWGTSNPQAVFAALLRAPESERRHNAFIQLAALWAETNPQAAAEAFKGQTSGDEQERGIAQAVTVWAKADPINALAWVDANNTSTDFRSPLREKLFASWASVEPEAAARFALSHDSTATELDSILGSWAHADLEAAVNFQKTQLPPEKQNRARPALLLAAGSQNSPLADSLLQEFLAANPSREELLRIAKSLSSVNPRVTENLLNQVPAGPDTEALRNRIARTP